MQASDHVVRAKYSSCVDPFARIPQLEKMSDKRLHANAFQTQLFQELAVLCATNDTLALILRRDTLASLDIMYVRWLAIPAVKSGRAGALKLLRHEAWTDPKFRDDVRMYATKLGNRAALVYLDELDAAFAANKK